MPPDTDGQPAATDDEDDGSEEGPSVIVGYYIQYLEDGASNWAHIKNKNGGNLITNAKGEPDITYSHTGLAPGSSREYRMAAVNKISSSEQRSDWTELVKGSTVQIPRPNAVAGLVVEATGLNTVDMTWLAQAEQPQDAEVTEYVIEHSPDGKEGTFTMLTSVTMMTDDDVHTVHIDTGLSPSTERHYRVYAKNARGRSDQVSNVASATTDPADAPEAPSVTASATSDTEITVTWTAPADGGSEITGYVLQRAYKDADDTMTDFMTIAATDAATWWNTLDCPMMNAAIPDDATPAPPADDADTTSPYCEMYDGLAEDAKMVVDATFAANYGTITDTSYMDMGLMPETMYYYRVAAMNSVGRGEYSDGMDMATTKATNMAPTAGADIADQTVTAGMTVMVQSTITGLRHGRHADLVGDVQYAYVRHR